MDKKQARSIEPSDVTLVTESIKLKLKLKNNIQNILYRTFLNVCASVRQFAWIKCAFLTSHCAPDRPAWTFPGDISPHML